MHPGGGGKSQVIPMVFSDAKNDGGKIDWPACSKLLTADKSRLKIKC
jgi:hypothetical protein